MPQAWLWAVDGMLECIDQAEVDWTDEDEALAELLEAAICKVLCDRYGHQVEDDQCMRADHRYCAWCRTPMPNQPIGRVAPMLVTP